MARRRIDLNKQQTRRIFKMTLDTMLPGMTFGLAASQRQPTIPNKDNRELFKLVDELWNHRIEMEVEKRLQERKTS